MNEFKHRPFRAAFDGLAFLYLQGLGKCQAKEEE
jgi:hypothetical protein